MLPLCGKTPGFAIRSFFHRSMPCAEVYTAFSRTTIPASIITTNRHCDMNRCRNHHNEPSLRSAGRLEIHHNEPSLRAQRSNPFNNRQCPRQLFRCNQKRRRPCVCTGSLCQFSHFPTHHSSLITHNSPKQPCNARSADGHDITSTAVTKRYSLPSALADGP